jgi:hypothetical protein
VRRDEETLRINHRFGKHFSCHLQCEFVVGRVLAPLRSAKGEWWVRFDGAIGDAEGVPTACFIEGFKNLTLYTFNPKVSAEAPAETYVNTEPSMSFTPKVKVRDTGFIL